MRQVAVLNTVMGDHQVEGAGGASTADGASNGQVKPEPGAAEAPLALAGQLAVKTEVGAASPLAVPGQQPQPLIMTIIDSNTNTLLLMPMAVENNGDILLPLVDRFMTLLHEGPR